MKKLKIPYEKFGKEKFVFYGNKREDILLIKLSEGNDLFFQYDGTLCRHAYINGSLEHKFQSDNQYFNPIYWYEKTAWGLRYPAYIHFKNDKTAAIINESPMYLAAIGVIDVVGMDDVEWNKLLLEEEENNKRLHRLADEYCISAGEVLQSIIGELSLKTGMEFVFPYDNTDYGIHWFEAYVPLVLNGENYLLTWNNCD